MKAPRCLTAIAPSVALCALVGAGMGFLWATGILDLLPSRNGRIHLSHLRHMTAEEYRSHLLWYPVYGLITGGAAGLALNLYLAVLRSRKPAQTDAAPGRDAPPGP